MAIKVKFSQGQTEAKSTALHQWDYGQVLEIECAELPTAVEVHFACPKMDEAIRRPCTVNYGVATVVIPNLCLEQSNAITAWVYEIKGSTGTTTRTITIPIIARTRPSRVDDEEIPQETYDIYSEMLSEINETVDALKSGNIMVAQSAKATSADRATSAENASTAAYAQSANYATSARTAENALKATNDHLGDLIATKYASFKDGFTAYTTGSLLAAGTYQFKVFLNNAYFQTFLTIGGNEGSRAYLGWVNDTGEIVHYMIGVYAASTSLYIESSSGGITTPPIYYRRINTN